MSKYIKQDYEVFITAYTFILYFRLVQRYLYQLNGELSGPLEEKKTILLPPGYEPRYLGRPASGLVTTLTSPWLQKLAVQYYYCTVPGSTLSSKIK